MARVYLDTSFISACVTTRADAGSAYRRRVSQEWIATQQQYHTCVISTETLAELQSPVYRDSDAALELVRPLTLVSVDPRILQVAEKFVHERVMPGPSGSGDALHVAACAIEEIPYLLSWNVRHLANPNKRKHLEVICQRLGLTPPTIMTPEAL